MVPLWLKKLPNRITLFRMVLVVFFIPTLIEAKIDERMVLSWLAFFIFVVASVSDFVDGYLARKYDIVSVFGKVMDPLADKILVISAFICFVWLQITPAWMVIIIVSREFLVSGIRIITAGKGEIIAASGWGKAKTIAEIVAILVILFLLAVNNTILHYNIRTVEFVGDWTLEYFLLRIVPYWFMFFATAITVISGMEYFFQNKRIFDEEV